MNPITTTAHVIDYATKRSLRNERSLVAEPDRARRLLVQTFGLFVLVLALMATKELVDAAWYVEAVDIVLALLAILATLSLMRRMLAFRNGWIDGRAAMLDSLREANNRGIDYEDWVKAEITRDFMVLGANWVPSDRGRT